MTDNRNYNNMLRVGTVLHGTYRIEAYLASGGFGNTYEATSCGKQKAITNNGICHRTRSTNITNQNSLW